MSDRIVSNGNEFEGEITIDRELKQGAEFRLEEFWPGRPGQALVVDVHLVRDEPHQAGWWVIKFTGTYVRPKIPAEQLIQEIAAVPVKRGTHWRHKGSGDLYLVFSVGFWKKTLEIRIGYCPVHGQRIDWYRSVPDFLSDFTEVV